MFSFFFSPDFGQSSFKSKSRYAFQSFVVSLLWLSCNYPPCFRFMIWKQHILTKRRIQGISSRDGTCQQMPRRASQRSPRKTKTGTFRCRPSHHRHHGEKKVKRWALKTGGALPNRDSYRRLCPFFRVEDKLERRRKKWKWKTKKTTTKKPMQIKFIHHYTVLHRNQLSSLSKLILFQTETLADFFFADHIIGKAASWIALRWIIQRHNVMEPKRREVQHLTVT